MFKQLDAAGLSRILGDPDLPDVASSRRHLPLQGEVVWDLQEEQTLFKVMDVGWSSSGPVSGFYFDALKQD